MFRPEKMCFVNISVLDQSLTQVLSCLTKLGIMHIVDKKEVPSSGYLKDIDVIPIRESLLALDNRINELLSSLGIENRYIPAGDDINGDRIEINPFQIADKIEKDISNIEAEVQPVAQKIAQNQSEIAELEKDSWQLRSLEAHGVNVEDLREMRFLYLAFGTIPSELGYYRRLADSLERIPCVLTTGDIIAGRQQILAFTLASDKETLLSALDAAYFTKAVIPERYHGSIPDILDEIELEIWTKREDMAESYAELKALKRNWQNKLLDLHDNIAANRIVIDSMENFGKTDKSYFLSGWVPYRDVKNLQKELEKIPQNGILMNATEPITAQESENYEPRVPTKLRHPAFLRPFTGLIKTFDVPRYSAIDPTLFVSLSYLAMFGVMFADVGHGAVLLFIGLLGALYPHAILKPIRGMAMFLAYCGGASIVTGLLFGSIFGKEDIIKPFWFSLEHMNPESVNHMLKLGVFFGIGMISLGVLLNIFQCFRRKNLKEAFFGQWGISSLSAYWMAVYLLLSGGKFSWDKVVIISVFLLPIMLKEPVSRLVESRKHKHEEHEESEEEGEGIIESAFQIYEVALAYLANTLSYIRVAAFDLSHASLMMAVYLLTDKLGGSDNIFLSLPSNIMANVFVILLEGLIVAIQGMRLEYYEFFSKFFAGEGIEYKPLKIN